MVWKSNLGTSRYNILTLNSKIKYWKDPIVKADRTEKRDHFEAQLILLQMSLYKGGAKRTEKDKHSKWCLCYKVSDMYTLVDS